MSETNTIDSLLEEGNALSATLDYKKKEKSDTATEKDKEIDTAEQQLFAHYRNALPALLEEAVRLMRAVPGTPFELRLLLRDDGMYEETHQYSRFSLFKNSDGTLVYTPETIHWRNGGCTWDGYRNVTTLQHVLDSKETTQKDVMKMYEVFKEFITKFCQNTE